MSSVVPGLVLDILVLVFLGAMIFYAMRLTNSLNAFRRHREDFDQIITSLVTSINQAEKAIQNLKETGQNEAAHIEGLIKQSRGLSEELKIMNEASDSMARRLEMLAEKNRKIVQGLDVHAREEAVGEIAPAAASGPVARKREERPAEKARPPSRRPDTELRAEKPVYAARNQQRAGPVQEDFPSFMIEDRDGGKSVEQGKQTARPMPEQEAPANLQSQAERELYEALQKNRLRRGGAS